MAKKRMLSRTEVIKAHGLFVQHLSPADREGYFKYHNGWDDAKVAQEIDPTIQINVIARLRTELFGQIETAANINRDGELKIKELETLYTNLLACYGELESKFNKLIDTLCLNEHMNVKHLKTTVKNDPSTKS